MSQNKDNHNQTALIPDLSGIGSQVDGRVSEYAAYCTEDNNLEKYFEITTTLNLSDLGLNSQYVDIFKPKAYLKAWIRFVNFRYQW